MKKVIIYVLLIIILVFSIPFIFTNINIVQVSYISDNQLSNSKDSRIIKLLHESDGSVEELEMNEYLYGVVASEMPAQYEIEALKAQAVVARTYTIYQIENGGKHENANICDSSNCCQAWISKENRMAKWDQLLKNEYWEKIENAVNETDNLYITYKEKPINAFFHSNSGGKTELASNVWGKDLPYLKIVETNGEDNYNAYKSEVRITKKELINKMKELFDDFSIDSNEGFIKIIDYTESGRVKNIMIGNKTISGVDARKIFGLKSSNFNFEIQNDSIIFSVIGYGHGVGLSQSGSDVLAKKGLDFKSIIKYYYKDVEIVE